MLWCLPQDEGPEEDDGKDLAETDQWCMLGVLVRKYIPGTS